MINNADFWTSIASIINDGFTSEGLQKLERYAEQFISREIVYKRFSSLEQYGCAAGGTTHVIATLLAGAKTDADTLTSGIFVYRYKKTRIHHQHLISGRGTPGTALQRYIVYGI